MPVTLYLGERPEVVIRVSAVAELTAAIHAFVESGHHPASRQWVTTVRERVSDDVLRRISSLGPLFGAMRARYLFPLTSLPQRSFEEELSDIEALPIERFSEFTAQALLSLSSSKEPPDVLRNRSSRSAFLASLQQMSWQRADLGQALVSDSEGLRQRVISVLREAFRDAFADNWAELLPTLNADVQRRRHDWRARGASVLSDFPGASEFDDPPRVVFDKLYFGAASLDGRACVVVPSHHVNPHIVIKHLPDFPVVIQYSISAVTHQLKASDVQKRIAVLNDPTRLTICRAILRRPMAGIELAQLLGMSPPQVSRHLRALREAGLVHRRREGNLVRYELDQGAVRRLGADLVLTWHR
ncbi:MAG TPA: DUF5937 family protein [Terrimesophilobacter sp.]|nr:DUF5937 family protein [Terrimesophilobacter sp.]